MGLEQAYKRIFHSVMLHFRKCPMLEHLNIGASVMPSKNQFGLTDQAPLTTALNNCLKNLRYQVHVPKTGSLIDFIASPGIWGYIPRPSLFVGMRLTKTRVEVVEKRQLEFCKFYEHLWMWWLQGVILIFLWETVWGRKLKQRQGRALLVWGRHCRVCEHTVTMNWLDYIIKWTTVSKSFKLDCIFCHTRHLISLDVWRCRFASTETLHTLADSCPNLEEVDIGWW